MSSLQLLLLGATLGLFGLIVSTEGMSNGRDDMKIEEVRKVLESMSWISRTYLCVHIMICNCLLFYKTVHHSN